MTKVDIVLRLDAIGILYGFELQEVFNDHVDQIMGQVATADEGEFLNDHRGDAHKMIATARWGNRLKELLQSDLDRVVVKIQGVYGGVKKTVVDLKAVRRIISADGMFESGPYKGLYITTVLKSMADSSWDYPAAMEWIAQVLDLIDEWETEEGYPMRPSEGEMYVGLIEVCPEVDWTEAPGRWDT